MSFDLAQLKARLPALVAARGLSADLLQRASQTARAQGVGFCAALVNLGVDEAVVLELMSDGTGLALVRALPDVEPGVGDGFDEARCRAMQICPLAREADGSFVIACVDPLVATSPDMRALPPHRLVLVTRALLETAFERVFGVPTDPEKPPVARTQPLKVVDHLHDGLPPVIGGFHRLSRLGEGGMAVVFRAQELSTGRVVALKVMLPHLARDKEFVGRFLQEAQASLRLAHPHAVAVYGAGEDGGAPYIASEFIDRGTLEDLLKRTGPMPAPLALELFAQALEGVAAAHDVGIIHRDLKPANLLLSSAGLVKVGDFGIAKLSGGAKLTQTGIVVGTPAYMSPEQATGGQLGPASDLFAMGVILYELLSGTNPHHADSGTAAVMRVLTATVPPILRVVPSVPVEVEGMLHRLLAKDPAARSSSAREWLPQLAKWLEPWRANGQNLVQAVLENPKPTCEAIALGEARRLHELARTLTIAGGPDRRRAAFLLYRAALMAPADAAIGAAFRDVCGVERLTFGEATNPKIRELETAWAAAPDAPGVLQQLANLYRLEGNAWRAAFYLRSYVRLRPQDGYAIGQLAQITGEAAAPIAPIPLRTPSNPYLAPVRGPSHSSLPPVAGPAQPTDQAATMRIATGPRSLQPPAAPDSFREYDGDEGVAPLPVALWRVHGKTILSVGAVALVVFVVIKAILSFIDSATTTGRPTRPAHLAPVAQPPVVPVQVVDDAATLIEGARAALDAGNPTGAVNRLNDFMTRFPSHERYDEAKILRAEAYLELNSFPNAEADASDVMERQPPESQLYTRAARVAERARAGSAASAPPRQPPQEELPPLTPEERGVVVPPMPYVPH